jgi:hypothetical protein
MYYEVFYRIEYRYQYIEHVLDAESAPWVYVDRTDYYSFISLKPSGQHVYHLL